MSLLSDAMEPCVMLNKVSADDGYGGETISFTRGAHFDAAIVFDTSVQARVAQAQGVQNMYTITVHRVKTLDFHDVFMRERDGKIFRVTSDGKDKKTPSSAGLDMRQVTAEEFVLPGDIR